MFNKNKKENKSNWADEKRKRLFEEIINSSRMLEIKVRKVIIKNGVINIYPDGADKNIALKDLDKEKHLLLCEIGRLDCAISEYNNFCDRYYKEFISTADWVKTVFGYESHNIIEKAYKDFYLKNG